MSIGNTSAFLCDVDDCFGDLMGHVDKKIT